MHQRMGDGDGSAVAVLGRASFELAGLLEDAELWRLSSRQVTAGVDAAYRLVAQAHTVALSLLGELDARGLAVDTGAPSTLAWLTAKRRMRQQEARRDVTLARLLHAADTAKSAFDGERTAAAVEGAAVQTGLAKGDVNVDQAGVIATALLELPEDATTSTRVLAEELLVGEAAMHGPVALTRLGHRIVERVDPDAADRRLTEQLVREEREARRLRSGSRFSDGHGSVFYKFRVPVGDDAFIWPILDTLAAPEAPGGGNADTDTRSPQQRFADGFVEAMRRVGLDGGLPSRGGDRPRVLVTMDFDKLRTGVGAATMLDTGDLLDPGTVRRLACDALVIPQVLGGDSQILDQGRACRTAQGPLRLAVIARDGGCVHPGCTRPPRWCDVHHVVPWWNGGETNLRNCVVLCGFHHRLYDAGTWGILFSGDGIPECIPPVWIDRDQRPRRHERFHERRAF